MKRWQADLALLGCAVIWGLAFYFQKTAMAHIGPMLFLAARAVIGTAALTPLAWAERRRSARSGTRGAGGGIAIAGGIAFFGAAYLQQAGIVGATVTNAGLITALYVVVTPLLAWAVRRKAPDPAIWPAVALAFGGAWLLSGASVTGFGTSDWLIAGSTLLWAAHLLVTDQAAGQGGAIRYTQVQFATVALIALPLALVSEPVSLAALLAAWPEILFVGILSSAVTFTLMAIALRYAPVADATVLMSLETLFAALAGFALLGERMAPIGWAGAGLMFGAVLFVQLARFRAPSGAPPQTGAPQFLRMLRRPPRREP